MEKYNQLISTLPLNKGWAPISIYNYQGFWHPDLYLPGTMAIQDTFHPRATDILLISPPKSGTTWLKALTFAIVTRKDYSSDSHPLRTLNPHDCVPFMDKAITLGQSSNLETNLVPRLLSTHTPYSILPETVTDSSSCRIVYICRDPKDTLVSAWYFLKEMTPNTMEPVSFNSAFELFCEGISPYGPIWDHYLEYWKESLRRPSQVLFLKYEDVMTEPVKNLRKLAEFVSCPFSQEEEEKGVLEEILSMCSFDKLSKVEGNKGDRGLKDVSMKNSSFFRKGKVGDWKNHFTSEMAERLDGITEERLHGSGLNFNDF